MTIRKLEIERFSVTSSKSFDIVVAAFEAAVGHPNIFQFLKATADAKTLSEVETIVHQALGREPMIVFMKLDNGAILRKETGRDSPKMARFLVGNPLIMKEMVKRTPDAASYAPTTILIDERPDGVHLSYDRMVSLLAPYGDPESLAVAGRIDAKIEKFLREIAANDAPL